MRGWLWPWLSTPTPPVKSSTRRPSVVWMVVPSARSTSSRPNVKDVIRDTWPRPTCRRYSSCTLAVDMRSHSARLSRSDMAVLPSWHAGRDVDTPAFDDPSEHHRQGRTAQLAGKGNQPTGHSHDAGHRQRK